LVGGLVVAQGVVDLTIVVATRDEHPHWPARLAADAVQIALGITLLARPADTVRAASVIIGALAILAGGVEIAAAVAQRHSPPRAATVA